MRYDYCDILKSEIKLISSNPKSNFITKVSCSSLDRGRSVTRNSNLHSVFILYAIELYITYLGRKLRPIIIATSFTVPGRPAALGTGRYSNPITPWSAAAAVAVSAEALGDVFRFVGIYVKS